MRVLVIGSGAGEPALVARLALDRDVGDILAAPGNPGIASLARTVALDVSNPDAILALADREQIDLTVVGPELPLSVGVADRFAADGRLLFGPTAAAARLESSKAFAKTFTAQDHKRVFDDDRGPNTGGMGAFAPSPLVDAALETRIMREIVDPVLAGMAADGHPFRGFLYVGLMLTADGPKVIEFNVRLGDPETQVVLPLIDEPLLPLLVAGATGALRQTTVRLGAECLTGVVLASRGYPESSSSGQVIEGIAAAEAIPGVAVYHAGAAIPG